MIILPRTKRPSPRKTASLGLYFHKNGGSGAGEKVANKDGSTEAEKGSGSR
jgi:hypothetical protein